MLKRGGEKGQVTIFIIVAILIVIMGILIYMFYPQIKASLGGGVENPGSYIQTCIGEEIQTAVDTLSSQGGSINPEHYILYQDTKIEYLCYTGEYYLTCVVQQPMLKNHIESEIESEIRDEVKTCFDNLKESYEKKGYSVNLRKEEMDVELLPKRIVTTFNYSLALKKGDDSQTYKTFRVVLDNNLYELVSIANSIISWETKYGDAETTTYMNYYHDLKVEKKKQSDGSTIYILTDRNTGDKFQFASRSVAWPPGYGASGVVMTSYATQGS
ncbi:MAG TPA: hypothetical protein ENG87_04220 [Candidatus Pacearchaeota archaeon]|nr:hypothetical protein BMS3Abin17_00697 [archaeon BMS3Abin17]HDK42560.1 hypothetical protein [Candidatus Pacearchaeota archaeon]HDZ60990.1 hypothetical protein [Candidatus Pacearchaeota archaeon]